MANNSSEERWVDIEEPEEKKAESVVGLWKSSIAKITSFRKDGKNRPPNTIWPRIKKITDPQGRFLQMWNMIFIISCVFAVSLDPLFFYIPIIDRDIKCLKLDIRLKPIAFALRSLTDLFYMVDLVLQILLISKAKPSAEIVASQGTKTSADRVLSETKNTNLLAVVERAFGVAKRILQSYIIVVDILAVLPIPQVVIFIFFSQMKGSRCLKTRKLLNAVVLLQYIPRILRIYLLCKECKKTPKKPGIWAKSVFNFFLYILASHVLGALWYFFAIQRETACWKYACRSGDGCEVSSFDCNDIHTLRNVTLLNNLCPVHPSNATLFDFGIFLDALQSGMVVSTDFPEKFLYCFWWGLRNLSSLGQNFQTSTYAWENLFAVFISIIGLLLFLYLIGNLQTYLQLSTTRSEKVRRKMETKGLEIDLWLSRKGLPKTLKKRIMVTVERQIKENKEVQVDNILTILPPVQSNTIRRFLRLATLKEVSILKAMDEKLLKAICDHLQPCTFIAERCIIREGDKLDRMIFIRQGIVRTYKTNWKSGSKLLVEGEIYGGELLSWASNFTTSDFPKSTRNAKSVTNVEAFVLMADDLKSVVNKFWWHFTKDKELSHYFSNLDQLKQLQEFAYSAIQRQVHLIKNKKQEKFLRLASTGQGSKNWQKAKDVLIKDPEPSPKSPLAWCCFSQGN